MSPSERRDRFPHAVEDSARRKRRARERPETVWFGLGMFGLVGWSVAVPTLLGIALGVWLDGRSDTSISWTLTCMVMGVAVGCALAWWWVRQEAPRPPESEQVDERSNEEAG